MPEAVWLEVLCLQSSKSVPPYPWPHPSPRGAASSQGESSVAAIRCQTRRRSQREGSSQQEAGVKCKLVTTLVAEVVKGFTPAQISILKAIKIQYLF